MNWVRVGLLAFGVLAACDEKKGSAPAPVKAVEKAAVAPAPAPAAPSAAAAPSAEDKAAAVEIFNNRCTPCHGPQGRGDGPASASLTPHPRNFGEAEWQKAVTDEHIEKIIVYGGAAVGKSPAMPANPDLDQKPGVVKELRAHIRSLQAAP